METQEKISLFANELATITEGNIIEFTKLMLDRTDEWFYHDGASTTGKYHPVFAQGDGGLVRHTRALIYWLNEFQRTEMFALTEHEWNLLKSAAIAHDIRKHVNGIYVSDHAKQASNFVKELTNETNIISSDDMNFMCSAIESHMGIWDHKKIGSPRPEKLHEKLLALSDICASRKETNLSIFELGQVTSTTNNTIIPEVEVEMTMDEKIDSYRMTFGKNKGLVGLSLNEVVMQGQRGFLEWAAKQNDFNDKYGQEIIIEYLKRNK